VLRDTAIEGSLLIENGRIARIGASLDSEPTGGVTEDMSGLTVFPGFVDVHIHGAVGVDAMEATPEDLRGVASFLATQGVTSWLPTLVPSPDVQYQHAVEAIAEALTEQKQSPARARVLGVHYEGPFVSAALCGALHSIYFRTYTKPADLDELPVPKDAAALKMITVAPEIEGGIDLIKELKKRDWVISIGHTRADLAQLDQAREAGALHMTHFMNAMPSLHHRAPGPVGWGLAHDDVTCDIIADGIHLQPEMLKLLVKLKSPNRLCLISDAIAAAGLGDGSYRIWDETIEVTNRRTSNAKGSIAGSVITMLDAVRLMISLGVSEVEVARMAATNPAQLLGAEDFGSISVGQRADLVALDEQYRVALTVVGGQIAFDRR
jgi:N-acetylglucosamine-6-phosphate deacetylase